MLGLRICDGELPFLYFPDQQLLLQVTREGVVEPSLQDDLQRSFKTQHIATLDPGWKEEVDRISNQLRATRSVLDSIPPQLDLWDSLNMSPPQSKKLKQDHTPAGATNTPAGRDHTPIWDIYYQWELSYQSDPAAWQGMVYKYGIFDPAQPEGPIRLSETRNLSLEERKRGCQAIQAKSHPVELEMYLCQQWMKSEPNLEEWFCFDVKHSRTPVYMDLDWSLAMRYAAGHQIRSIFRLHSDGRLNRLLVTPDPVRVVSDSYGLKPLV
jgi:hypothetical protein